MYKPERSKYLFASITESFEIIFNMNQKDNESLLEYSKLLKQAKEILEEHGSIPHILQRTSMLSPQRNII